MKFEASVEVQLKEGIADPQGATIENATPKLGFSGIENVRVGKNIRFIITADSEVDAQSAINASIPFILISNGYTDKKINEIKHDHLIENFVGLEKIIIYRILSYISIIRY